MEEGKYRKEQLRHSASLGKRMLRVASSPTRDLLRRDHAERDLPRRLVTGSFYSLRARPAAAAAAALCVFFCFVLFLFVFISRVANGFEWALKKKSTGIEY